MHLPRHRGPGRAGERRDAPARRSPRAPSPALLPPFGTAARSLRLWEVCDRKVDAIAARIGSGKCKPEQVAALQQRREGGTAIAGCLFARSVAATYRIAETVLRKCTAMDALLGRR